MFPATVEALRAVMFACGIGGALLVSGAWLSRHRFWGRSSRQGSGEQGNQDWRR